MLYDSTRGVTKVLSNLTNARSKYLQMDLTLLILMVLLEYGNINVNTVTTYVAWQWKANGGTTSSNTDGTITSTVQAILMQVLVLLLTRTTTNAYHRTWLRSNSSSLLLKQEVDSDNWCVWHQRLQHYNGQQNLLLNQTC